MRTNRGGYTANPPLWTYSDSVTTAIHIKAIAGTLRSAMDQVRPKAAKMLEDLPFELTLLTAEPINISASLWEFEFRVDIQTER